MKKRTLPQCILNMIYIPAINAVTDPSTYIYNLVFTYAHVPAFRTKPHASHVHLEYSVQYGVCKSSMPKVNPWTYVRHKAKYFFDTWPLSNGPIQNHAYDRITNSAGRLHLWRMSIIEINLKSTVKHNTLTPYINVLLVSVQQNHQQASILQNFKIIRKFATCNSFISEYSFGV